MTWDSILEFVRSLWVVWLMALFIGIVVWVMWPRRKKKLESYSRIPLEDDDSSGRPSKDHGKSGGA